MEILLTALWTFVSMAAGVALAFVLWPRQVTYYYHAHTHLHREWGDYDPGDDEDDEDDDDEDLLSLMPPEGYDVMRTDYGAWTTRN